MNPSGRDDTKLMYLKCAHPECTSDFDYAQGRFYRFQQSPRQNPLPANSHSVKHFWLCTRCCQTFTIDYQKGLGVILRQRLESLAGGQLPHYVLMKESDAKLKLPRPLGRSRPRKRTRQMELTTGQTTTIEILENRISERRG